MTQTPEAVRARAARRRHLQQRQTVIFGSLVAALLVIAVVAGAMWSGVVPSPVSVPLHSGGGVAAPEPVVPPCPPEGALPVPYEQIGVHVFNGTEEAGLAGRTALTMGELGMSVGEQANGEEYGGVALLTAGPAGIPSAYTLAGLFSSSQIVLDEREDATVDVLLGVAYEAMLPPEEALLDPATPIPAPDGCTPIGSEPAATE